MGDPVSAWIKRDSQAVQIAASLRFMSATNAGRTVESRPVAPTTRRPHVRGKGWWAAGYALVAVAPLVAVLVLSDLPGRTMLLELGSAFGVVALTLLALQLVLPSRWRIVAAPLGADVAVRLHRRMADVLVAAIVAHVAFVFADDVSRVGLLDPIDAPWRARAAVISCLALGALIAMAILRGRIGLSYARWRGWHIALGALALVAAAIHTIGVGRYLTDGPLTAVLAVATAAGLGALVELRLLRPARLARHPYTVRRVRAERGGAATLELSASGHSGHRFRPTQFAWLRLADDSRRLVEHPFSYSSSALDPAHPEITIKTYAGITRELAAVTPGTRVLLDGPHGAFRPSARAAGFVLIAGGIGITPAMSLLRTHADQRDSRPHLLFYGSVGWDDVIFREELDELGHDLSLRVVHVLNDPPEDWAGERGFLDAAVLGRHLADDISEHDFFVCGPPGMTDAAIRALDAVGVPPEQVHTERFVAV